MAADWEEVKRLAADFQRAQLSSTVQKLSERNCIEIVKKLIELKLIDVIFTSDGKEYLTPQRLLREIKDELFVHGGRINIVELSQILGVDYSYIEVKSIEFSRSEPGVRLVLGQLITNDYLDHISEEINEKLQEIGQITVAELTKLYDLPGDFLQEVVYDRLNTIIHAQPDPHDAQTFFTSSYILQYKATVQGVLSAVTRPILVSSILSNFEIPERLFYTVCDELIKSKRIRGSLSSGYSDKSLFIPDIYARGQNDWADAFYKQNGYLEYDSLSRLGILDSKAYIKKRFQEECLTFLSSCAVGKSILSQVGSAIEDALTSGTLVDIMLLLPSVFVAEDYQQIIKSVVKMHKLSGIIRVYGSSVVISDSVIQSCLGSFDSLMTEKAKEDIVKKPHLFLPQASSKATQPKKEEQVGGKGKPDKKDDKKKKGGKSGGGTQGRETKIKAVKKKYHTGKGNNDDMSDDESSGKTSRDANDEFEFLDATDISDYLQKNILVLQECDDDLILEIAEELQRPLNKKYEEVAKALFLSTYASSALTRKKQYAEFQEKINNLLPHITLFERSTKLFSDDVATQLSKYLLKTLCTDMTNMLVELANQEHGASTSTDLNAEFTQEARLKLIEKLPDEVKPLLKKLHNSLGAKTTEEFSESLDEVLDTDIGSMISRKLDKKKERLMLSNNRQSLLSQLSETNDPALCLHLSVLLIFQTQTRNILHASGKFVPHIIWYLQKHVPFYQDLAIYQEHVKRVMVNENAADVAQSQSVLLEMMPKIKEHAGTFKKVSLSETES